MFIKKAAIVAVALAGQAYVEGVSISKRDGAHGHHAAAAAPASGYGAPASGYGAPAAAPASGYGAPAAAPASSYGAPATSYGAPAAAPAASYGAPDTGYGAPADSYGAPDTGYGAPAGYDAPAAPSYGATGEEEVIVTEGGGPGILPFVAVILAIIGLSLLFPAVVNVGRKKRSLAEESNPISDVAERVNEIYGAVLESEECMEKIACELGAMAKDLTSSPMTSLVEPFVPAKYSSYYKTFARGTNCDKIKCGKAF
jgi:hypothetical protein